MRLRFEEYRVHRFNNANALDHFRTDGELARAVVAAEGNQADEASGPVECAGRFGERYRIVGRLGSGGVGEVFLVADLEAGGEVAIKAFPAYGSSPAVTPERVRAEAHLNRAVRHANVVQLLDMGHTEDGLPFVVTEALVGETLGERLRRCGELSIEESLRVVREAARGLAAIHRANVVHCDVKPDNIFLCDETRHGVFVKIIDFGFALESTFERDKESQVFGTLPYISPEQALAEKVDARSDIYSLGVVFFRALTGELPFDACNRQGLLAHHLASTIPPPSWLRQEVTADLDELLLNMVRKNPENRYENVDVLLTDIDRLESQKPLLGVSLQERPDEYVPTTEDGRAVRAALLGRSGINPRV